MEVNVKFKGERKIGRRLWVLVSVSIIIVAAFMYILIRSNIPAVPPKQFGQIELSFSEAPNVNKTINVTLSFKMQEKAIDMLIGSGGGFVFFVGESNGFEWAGGEASSYLGRVRDILHANSSVSEIDEPYFKYKNCPDVWGEKGKVLQLIGTIKVTKPGNWSIGGGFGRGIGSNYTTPQIFTEDFKNTYKTTYAIYQWRTFVTFHIAHDSSYILVDWRTTTLGNVAMAYYHYRHPSLYPEGYKEPVATPPAGTPQFSKESYLEPVRCLSLNLSLSSPLNVNDPFDIICNLTSTKDLWVRSTIRFLHGKFEIIEGNTSWDGIVRKSTPSTYQVTVKLIDIGNFTIYAEAYNASNNYYADWRIIYFTITQNVSSIKYFPSDDEAKYRYCYKTNDNITMMEGNSITIKGGIKSWDGAFERYLPAARIRVDVYDTWWGKIASAEVPNDGEFEIVVSDAGRPATGRKLYAEFVPECANVKVSPEYWWLGWYYAITTCVVWVPNGGTWTIDTIYSGGANSIYGYAIEGWRYMYENGYGNIGETRIVYPYETTPHYHPLNKEIHLPDWDYSGTFGAWTVLHEYGHHVMNMGMGWPPGGSVLEHSYLDELTPNQAWTEGWADFFPYPVWDWIASSNQYSTPYGRSEIEDVDMWGGEPGQPHSMAIKSDGFSVKWTGKIKIDVTDTYTFYLVADEGAKLYIDNILVIDIWAGPPFKKGSGSIYLTTGDHDVTIDYYDDKGSAIIAWYWSSSTISKQLVPYDHLSCTDHLGTARAGLLGEYSDGSSILKRADPVISFWWGIRPPFPIIGRDTFTINWVGKIKIDSADTYRFWITADDGIKFYIDGNLLIDAWYDHYATHFVDIILSAGLHDISLYYYENKGNAIIQLLWTSSTLPTQTIPQANLYYFDEAEEAYIQGGLEGFYYDRDAYHAEELKMVRIDPEVYFEWRSSSPIQIWTKVGPVWEGSCYPPHDVNELRVASALYDLYDGSTDGLDLFTGSFYFVWDTICLLKPNNFGEFWSAIKSRYGEYPTIILHPVKKAMFWNTINYNNAPTCTIVSPDPNIWHRGVITLSATVSDSDTEDSSYLQAEFWYTVDFSTWCSGWTYIGTSSPGMSSVSWDSAASSVTSSTVYVKVRAFDGIGYSWYWSCSNSFKVDNTAPIGSIVIASGATYTTSRSVTLTLSASDVGSGVYQMCFSNDGTTYTAWEAYATTKAWTLTTGDGTKTVYVKYKDNAGVVSIAYSDTIILDTTAPTGSIVINSGATYTSSRSVTLTLSASDIGSGVYQMCFSNDGTTYTAWEAYATTKAWTLASGDGTKTVYVKYKDNVGFVSIPYSDTIILDTTPPTGSISINSGATYTASTSVTLTLTYSDATSGVSQVRYSNDGTWDTETWESPSGTKSWTLPSGDGTKTVWYQIKDAAGNTFTTSDTIILDTTAPTISNVGVSLTSNSATITWETNEETTGIIQLEGTLFEDNFDEEDSYGWYEYGGEWYVDGGRYYSPIASDARSYAGATQWANYTVGLLAEAVDGSLRFGVIARSYDIDSSPYCLIYLCSDGPNGAGLYLYEYLPPSGLVLRDFDSLAIELNYEYWIRADFDGTYVYAWIESSYRGVGIPPPLAEVDYGPLSVGHGRIGLIANNTRVAFDNVKVTLRPRTGSDLTYRTEHSVTIGGLLVNANYNYELTIRDRAGNAPLYPYTDSFTITCEVELTSDVTSQIVTPGSTATYSIVVKNSGNCRDTINWYISTTSYPADWVVTLSSDPATLDSGEDVIIYLNVVTASRADETGYVTITAISYGDPDKVASLAFSTSTGVVPIPCLPIIIISPPYPILPRVTRPTTPYISEEFNRAFATRAFCGRYVVAPPYILLRNRYIPTYSSLLDPGASQTYSITITNYDNVTHTIYVLALGGVLDSWHAEYDQGYVTLGPKESITVNITIIAPADYTTEYQAIIIVQGILEDGTTVDYAAIIATLSIWMNPTYAEELTKIIQENTIPEQALNELNTAIEFASGTITLEKSFDAVRRAIKMLEKINGTESLCEALINATRSATERTVAYAGIQTIRNNTWIEKALEWYATAINTTERKIAMKQYILTYMSALQHNVENYYSFEVTISPGMRVKLGETANYTITLTNTGILDDEYNLLLITGINSTWINFPTRNIENPANSFATILLQFILPSNLPLMYDTTYQFEVRATSVYAIDINDSALTKNVSQRLTVIATKESKTRYMINETTALLATLETMNIQSGVKNSLRTKLQNALDKLNTALQDILNGNENHANNMLNTAENQINAFINEVNAQKGKKISEEDADVLVTTAQTIMEHIDDTIATPI